MQNWLANSKEIIKVSLFIELNVYENIFMFLNILRYILFPTSLSLIVRLIIKVVAPSIKPKSELIWLKAII